MKKLFIFIVLLAGIAVMTGCQKDKDVVTLKAVMGQDTKAYFGNESLNLPYWDADDEVFVSGQSSSNTFSNTFGLTSPNTTFATITNVPASDVYCAIFPSSIVQSMGTPSASGTTASIYYNPHQFYQWDATNTRQRVDMPMGAVTTDETLIFKNLCSIIRLNVTNALANSEFQPTAIEHANRVDFDVKRLTITATGAYVAGFAEVTLSESGAPVINMNTPNHLSSDNVLSVYDPDGNSMGTIYKSSNDGPTSKSFDIIVPPFTSTNDFVIEVEMYTRHNNTLKALGYLEHHFDRSVSVDRNKIVQINLNVDRYKIFDYAYLESGPEFKTDLGSIINSNIQWIKFNHNPGALTGAGLTPENQWDVATPTGWVELQASNSPHKIYGYITSDPTVLEINSFGSWIYCHSNCSHMFEGFSNVQNLQWTEDVIFKTDDVTDMSYMFKGCSSLTTLPNITSFNTTNVTNMAHMFDGCSAMTGLDLSAFNTHHLIGEGMVAMFKNCSTLQTLNLSNFTTEQITDMTDLFNGCSNMMNLHINQFVISNNTTLTNMCTGLNSAHNEWNKCEIRCTNAVKNTLLSQDENGNYITGIDPTKVYFTLQGGSAK